MGRSMSMVAIAVSLLVAVSACGRAAGTLTVEDHAPKAPATVAVFPVDNLSGSSAPLEEIRRSLIEGLTHHGVPVLDDATLERVVAQHRLRYMAGVEPEFARALKRETGVDGIVIPSLEAWDSVQPPRIALFARLVSTGEAPTVRWIDGIGVSGDDSPGILGLGLVDDPRVLLVRGLDRVAGSLAGYLAEGGARREQRSAPKRFRPRIIYRSDALDPARTNSVAVVPFFNKSARAYAGEIAALHMIQSLLAFPTLAVVEPGVLREELLRFRIIMRDGVSLAETETILNAVNADLVLNGEVLDYRDGQGAYGSPTVDFSVLFIERRTRRVVYSSYSHNVGDEATFFFDWGRINTAHEMASRMARAISERMLVAPPTARATRGR
jgi:hypothetical protein